MGLDMEVLVWIHENLSGGITDFLMKYISISGDYGAIWIFIILVLLIYKPTRKTGVIMVIALLFGLILNDFIIKPLVERPRPFIEDPSLLLSISAPGGYSFASGHATKAFAVSSVLFIHDKKWGTPLMIYATLMAFSRMYLLVHYASDVIVGAFIGMFCAVAAYAIVNHIKKKYEHVPYQQSEK
ncbi:MAG TPA: phosphatase PAP2 family protein [Candidatus Methanomethylophilaceae archaeon]|nr:phosphatase PAP2 family protein [Candidatus Methanomethylophilaceae archaeon]